MFDELSVKRMWPLFKEDLHLRSYFPDYPEGKKLPDRTYFFTILKHCHGDYYDKCLFEANNNRNSVSDEVNKNKAIVMTENWKKILTAIPFVSSKQILIIINPL